MTPLRKFRRRRVTQRSLDLKIFYELWTPSIKKTAHVKKFWSLTGCLERHIALSCFLRHEITNPQRKFANDEFSIGLLILLRVYFWNTRLSAHNPRIVAMIYAPAMEWKQLRQLGGGCMDEIFYHQSSDLARPTRVFRWCFIDVSRLFHESSPAFQQTMDRI